MFRSLPEENFGRPNLLLLDAIEELDLVVGKMRKELALSISF